MTTRQTSRHMFISRALARVGIAPALALALSAGTALGQPVPPAPVNPQGGPIAQPAAPTHSATAGAASSMVPTGEQTKKKVGTDDSESIGDVKVSPDQIVDLHVKDEDLTRVLELLAIQSQRNIIPTKSVAARVSANLYGVTFYEALDALLHPNGFGWMERNNRIEVYTLEELKQIEAASRVRIAKVIKLNYLNAIDAGAFVEALLSEGGQIKTNGKTSTFAIPEKTPVGQDDFANDAMLVVYDYEENVGEIERLIKEIDTRPSQVLVEATILQTQLNEANAFGVDFAVLGDLNFIDFSGSGGALSAVNSLIGGKAKTLGAGDIPVPGTDGEGRAIVSSPGNTAGPGTIKLGLVDNDVAVFLKMLDEVGDTTIISNPKVLALNRQPARVLVGRKVGYLNTTSTDTTTTQSVEFLDTGTQLYFRPFVTNEGLIRLELKPAVSEAVIRDARDATGAAVTIPDEITNEIVTNVLVRDGQTVVLGGLFREATQSSRRQVPFLGDIPILGAAFRGHDDETSRNEIIFMVTPSIVSDQVLVMQGERGSELVDKVRTGSRESLLLWSRERMSGQLLVEAERLASEGKTNEALFKIEQSLSMNHTQPEAIALRERLANKKVEWPARNMLDRIVRGEAAGKPAASKPTDVSELIDQPTGIVQNPGNSTASPNLDAPAASSGNTGSSSDQPAAPAATETAPVEPAPTDEGAALSGEPVNTDPADTDSANSESGNAEANQEQTQPMAEPASDVQPEAQPESQPDAQVQPQDVEGSTTGEAVPETIDPSSTQPPIDGQPVTADGTVENVTASVETSEPIPAPEPNAGLGQLSSEEGISGEQVADVTASTDPAGVDSGQYLPAWSWFYTGFRGIFLPTQGFFTASVNQSQPVDGQIEQPSDGEQPDTVSNAPSDNE
ncbi:MAG: hypothetical protein IT435_09470 [Phycisphaerales bacterium]|nr:hypothetical protein [Phycisphaerales bacterium]